MHFKAWLLLILFSLLSSGYCAAEQTSSTDEETPTARVADSSLTEENAELLDKYAELSDNLEALKAHSQEALKVDRIALLEFTARLQKELYALLDQLMENLKNKQQEGGDTDALRSKLKEVVEERSDILQGGIDTILKIRREFRNKGIGEKGAGKKDLVRWLNAKIEEVLDTEIGYLVGNEARMALLEMSGDDDRAYLDEMLPRRAVELSGRISLALDNIATLKGWLEDASPEEQKKIETRLRSIELQKTIAAESLSTTLDLMKQRNMETNQFGQILILATGELLTKTVDTKVALGLLQKAWRAVRVWLDENLSEIIVRIATFVLILLAFKMLARVVSRMLERVITRSKVKSSNLLNQFVQGITSKIIMLIGIIVALTQLGIELGPLLAGLGIMGFVIGFALQDALSNFASGMMILVTRPYDIGDVIDIGGVNGIVRSMNLISTTIGTFDNQEIVVPNNKVWGTTIRNVSSQKQRRVDLGFVLNHGVDTARAEAIFTEVVAADRRVLADPAPTIKLNKVGEYSCDYIVRPWVLAEDYWSFYWDMTRAIKERLDAEGDVFPHQQRDLFIRREVESI